MLDVLVGVIGVALAAMGGRLFVGGAVGVAAALRIPAGIIGATVAAFATSGPELAVAINAATSGNPAISFGDALGSNVINIALVLSSAIAIAGIRHERNDAARNLPIAVVAPLIIGLQLLDGRLSRVDGAVLLAVFFAWLAVSIGQALRARHAAPEVLGVEQTPRALLDAALGLLLLAVAGRLVVVAAHGMGQTLGLDQFVVGATLVAFGTSTPEIATVIVSRLRHHDEVGVGTIVGSNIFNSLWVVGIVALIQPFEVRGPGVALGLGASVVVALALIPWPSSVLGRRRGIALIVGYLAYATLLFLVPSSTAA